MHGVTLVAYRWVASHPDRRLWAASCHAVPFASGDSQRSLSLLLGDVTGRRRGELAAYIVRYGWIEPQGLVHHMLEIGHAFQIFIGRRPARANLVQNLLSQLPNNLRVRR